MSSIWVVTTHERVNNKRSLRLHPTFGWFRDIEDAQRAVEMNAGDMYERGFYRWASIGLVEPGGYRFASRTSWYEAIWDEETDMYKVSCVPCPKEFQGLCSFGWMGERE